jgi:hypothetical protein
MPDEEPVTSHEEPTIPGTSAQDAPAQTQRSAAYEPIDEQDEWMEEPAELPRRPRRRLLSPVPLALLGILLAACGFIGGVLVEKGQSTSGSSTAGAASSLASRFAALRTGASGAAGGSSAGGFAAGGSAPTAGSVAYISGSTLYVTNSEGNTVKVTTSAGTTVTKTVKADVKGIHPGETVTVTGASGSSGSINAESIRVGSSGGGGLGALFSGAGSSGKSQGGTGGGEPALFGRG